MAVSVAGTGHFSGLGRDTKEMLVASHAVQTVQRRAPCDPAATNFRDGDTKKNDFYRWRPSYHLMPRRNWANDPCGPGYSTATGYYHMSFQWNPYGWEWGNMSWGHAVSRDLVHWHVFKDPSIYPSPTEDRCGVFTGCTWPTDPRGNADGTLTSIYTSVHHSPIHWTLPYTKGSETVRMATSNDLGKSWERSPISPILPGPPAAMDVTGWRDPFVGYWESIDRCLHRKPRGFLYGVLAGGIRHQSPTVFLYCIDPQDLSRWNFISLLFTPGLNFKPSSRLPDFGTNFEVTNFMSLQDNLGRQHDVLIMGVEGALQDSAPRSARSRAAINRPQRARRTAGHSQNWICGNIQSTTDAQGQTSVALKYRFGGCLDYGCFYAANSFYDPVPAQPIVQGWVMDVDLPSALTARQKWAGLLSLPRVVGMRCMPNVTRCSRTDMKHLDWLHCFQGSDGTYEVTSLTSTPDPRLMKLRRSERRLVKTPCILDDNDETSEQHVLALEARHLEFQASFEVTTAIEEIGLILYHSTGKPQI